MNKSKIQLFTKLTTESKLNRIPEKGELFNFQIKPFYYHLDDGANFGHYSMQKPLVYKCFSSEPVNHADYGYLQKSHFKNEYMYINYFNIIHNTETGEILSAYADDTGETFSLEARKETYDGNESPFWFNTPLGCYLLLETI